MRLAAASNKSFRIRTTEPATAPRVYPREFARCQNCDFPRFRRSQLAIGLFYLDHRYRANIAQLSAVSKMMHNDARDTRKRARVHFQLSTFSSISSESSCSLRKRKRRIYEYTTARTIIYRVYTRRYRSIKASIRHVDNSFIQSIDRWAWKSLGSTAVCVEK